MCETRRIFNARTLLIWVVAIFGININNCNGEVIYRLDTSVIPEAYDIKIKPYLLDENTSKQFTFDGEVNITIYTVRTNVKTITLHKDYIDIIQATLYDATTHKLVQNFTIADWSYETVTDKLSINLKDALIVNTRYTLYFRYTGQIRNGMAGVFRASYLDENGNTKWIALTQAQRIDARTIVPCWDEPAIKAKFRMSISRPKEYISVFNTRIVDSKIDEHDSTRYLDIFEWTPVMSTYLLAFMISEYKKRGDADLAIFSRPEYYNYTEFTYSVAKKTLKAYDDYTKLPYKELGNSIMQKASSSKFPHNGMENWGLVLYRDSVLVQEPGYTDGWINKQYTITILVHETAHMWFGNSVTFHWWSVFWLNEAFARYYQYFLAHEMYPEYQLDQQFVTNQVHLIFGTDALNTTLPLTTPENLVQTPTEIGRMFSGIAYAKGASILRMFRNAMGHDNFDLAIHEYLKEFHLKNTEPKELFKHLKQHWPKEQQVYLDDFFKTWTEQVGFPVLMVYVSPDRNIVTLMQQRFLLSHDDGSDHNLRYTIPLTYTTNLEKDFDDLKPKSYFNWTSVNWTMKMNKSINWVIFNIQQSNYHRVFYESKTLNFIYLDLLKPGHSGIHTMNRAHLIDDLFNFARINMMDYAEVFKFLEYLAEETQYLPWQVAFTGLPRVAQRLTLKQQKNFGKFINEITRKVYKKLGFKSDNDTVLDVYNRNNVVQWTCKYGNKDCNEDAQVMLSESNRTNTMISPDFRPTVYCSALRYAPFKHYSILNNWFQNETRPTEKELLMRSLGCTVNFADYHYARILTDQIPQEYKLITLKPMYTESPENVANVLYMITTTYDRLAVQLGSYAAVADVISDLSNYLTTKDEQQTLDRFISEHGAEFNASISTLQKASKTVEDNLAWAELRLAKLLLYLESRNAASLSSIPLFLVALTAGLIRLLA